MVKNTQTLQNFENDFIISLNFYLDALIPELPDEFKNFIKREANKVGITQNEIPNKVLDNFSLLEFDIGLHVMSSLILMKLLNADVSVLPYSINQFINEQNHAQESNI